MFPKYHIIINFLVALPLLFIINPIYVLIFFFASFLIDFDHYLYYVLEKNSFSLKKAYNWFLINKVRRKKMSREERKKHQDWFLIFHGIEPLVVLAPLSFYFYPLFFIFLGFLVHMIEDMIEEIPLGVAEQKLFLTYAIYKYYKEK